MTYFNLRKHEPEPEPEEVEEEQQEEAEEEPEKKKPAKTYGPILTGILGPGQWIAARFGFNTAAIVHVLAVFSVFYYGGWTAVGVVLGWLLAVGLFTPSEALDHVSAWLESLFTPRPKPAARSSPGGEREAVRRLLLDVMGDADRVHLSTVLAHLQEHGQWEGKTVADLGVHLRALGVPVQPKVKVAGVPTRGVLKADLVAPSPPADPPPSPTPSPAV